MSLTCFLQIRKRWSRFSHSSPEHHAFFFWYGTKGLFYIYLSSSFNSGTTSEQVPLWVKIPGCSHITQDFEKGNLESQGIMGGKRLKANKGWPSSSVWHKRGLNFNITVGTFLKHNCEMSQFSDTFCWKFTALQQSWIHRNIVTLISGHNHWYYS